MGYSTVETKTKYFRIKFSRDIEYEVFVENFWESFNYDGKVRLGVHKRKKI